MCILTAQLVVVDGGVRDGTGSRFLHDGLQVSMVSVAFFQADTTIYLQA